MTMTLDEALALADHASPLPHLAGDALRVLRAEIDRLLELSLATMGEAQAEAVRARRRQIAGWLEGLNQAARSLRTIADLGGRDEYLMDVADIRAYANSRASIAEAIIGATPEPPDRRHLQQQGAHPAPCARQCEAAAFEIEIRQLRAEAERMREAIRLTLEENLHLADGEVCTLIHLKNALRPSTGGKPRCEATSA